MVSGQTLLSEAEFIEHQRRVHDPDYPTNFSQRELDNNSVDLQRFIEDHWKQLGATVSDSSQISDPIDVWDKDRIEQAVNAVVPLIDSKDWPAAIEAITQLVQHSSGTQRLEAILGRVKLLDFAGEYFLAKQERLG